MSNDLVEKEGLGLVVPGRGFEGLKIDRTDLLVPRAKLMQPLSPEVLEHGMVVGSIVNSLLVEHLPSRVVPIFCFKSYLRFNARNTSDAGYDAAYEPGALIWRSTDPNDPRVQDETKFGDNGEKPLAMTCLNFFSLFPGVAMPIIVSFSKTSYRTGKQLLSLARFCGGDMWSHAYQLGSTLQKNEQGTYYTLTIASLGASSESERRQAEAWWTMFSQNASELKVHEETEPGADLNV